MHRMKTHPEAALGDCPARFDNYVCTRDAGHDGSHMATRSLKWLRSGTTN